MTIRARLSLLFLLGILLASASGAYSVRSLGETQEALGEARRRQESQLAAQSVQILMLRWSQEIRDYCNGQRATTPDAELEALQTATQALKDRTLDPDIRVAADNLATTIEDLTGASQKARFLRKQGDGASYLREWVEKDVMPEADAEVMILVESHRHWVTRAGLEASMRNQRVVNVLGLAIAGQLVLGIAVFLLLWRWIVRPVDHLVRETHRIAQGDHETIEVQGHDELTRLTGAINEMTLDLALAQRELVERERMAAMGELTFAVAHNIRNPLASIRAMAQGSLHDVEEDEETREALVTIMRTVDKVDRWLKDLLVSLRPVSVDRSPQEVATMLQTVRSMAEGFAGERDIELTVDIAGDLPLVPLDRQRMDQALVSIVNNAVEASPAGEKVSILGRPTEGGKLGVRVIIEDHGPGLDDMMKSKMFAPGYTTKGSGTGMGLHLVQRIVFGHEGKIEVDSTPGNGCRITVTLPAKTRTRPE